jgi:hypothetical protein
MIILKNIKILARELRAPGLRAYFCRAAKVGKNALKPTV